MKKLFILLTITLLSQNICLSQEFFTSISIAKRLALVQDKMLFVVWEESLDFPYPLLYNDSKGNLVIIDLSKDKSLDGIIWEHFIPVLLPEAEYDKFIKKAEGRPNKYIAKLNDDSIKIMDANANILNTKATYDIEQNLSDLIKNYSLRTTFLKQDLINYSQQNNFTTSFNLGDKYIDFSLFVEEETREEIIELANLYLEESKKHLTTNNLPEKEAYSQRMDLLSLKQDLILNNPRKVRRLLRKIDETDIAEVNKGLYSFLNYTTFILLNDEENSATWKPNVSEADLKKAELILNINK
ncbi:MAG: hypothetical protein R2816_06305 [Flavobacteriaceae bacterium]